jgi:hypothetical protein
VAQLCFAQTVDKQDRDGVPRKITLQVEQEALVEQDQMVPPAV